MLREMGVERSGAGARTEAVERGGDGECDPPRLGAVVSVDLAAELSGGEEDALAPPRLEVDGRVVDLRTPKRKGRR